MMQLDYYAIFLVGFLSSFGHCIGMCGGFVMAYSVRISGTVPGTVTSKAVGPHILYNIGRVITYSFLGLLFGLAGETLGVRTGIINFQGILQIFAGILMIWLGIDFGGWIPAFSGRVVPGYYQFKTLLNTLIRRINRRNVFGLGLVLGFIPCGLVYAAGAMAAASGSAAGGMTTMLVFGLGTMPAMFALGVSANFITVQFRQRLFRIATILVILLGLLTVYRGTSALLNPGAAEHHHTPAHSGHKNL